VDNLNPDRSGQHCKLPQQGPGRSSGSKSKVGIFGPTKNLGSSCIHFEQYTGWDCKKRGRMPRVPLPSESICNWNSTV